MSDKKRREAIEVILKYQNLRSTPSGNPREDSQDSIYKKQDLINSDMDVLLSFTEDAFEELEEANDELAHVNKKLDVQNKIIQAYSKQQEIKIEELKFAYSQLEHFAQVGSHDLKEPLRNIFNFSQLLNDECADNIGEEGKAYLQFVLKGVHQLHNTLNHFIDYLQIDGQYKGAEIVDLNCLVNNVVAELKLQLGENSFHFKSKKLPAIAVNQLLFKRLMKELVINAIKFKHIASPKIEIGWDQLEDNLWLFKVKDNGVGLDEKLTPKIFLPFHRTENDLQNENRPIGLAICQKIVKLHKGDIWFDSTNIPGEGTTFLFTINNIAALPFENDITELVNDYFIPE